MSLFRGEDKGRDGVFNVANISVYRWTNLRDLLAIQANDAVAVYNVDFQYSIAQ